MISIHALVKRATTNRRFIGIELDISIHALVKRATLCLKIFTDFFDNFNPRPRKEGDVKVGKLL